MDQKIRVPRVARREGVPLNAPYRRENALLLLVLPSSQACLSGQSCAARTSGGASAARVPDQPVMDSDRSLSCVLLLWRCKRSAL
jgi:hypothetical protein